MTPFPREDYRDLSPYDPGRSPVAVDLSDNTNLWGCHPEGLDILRSLNDNGLARYPGVYASGLKAAVHRRYGVPMECVTTGCGSDDLLDSVFRCATTPPGVVSFPTPTFSMVEIFTRMNGLEPHPVPMDVVTADPTVLLESDPAVVYLCSPNNPTGESLPLDGLLLLLDAVAPEGPPVVLDEAYADFSGESLIPIAVQSPRLLVLRTLSKAHGLAGLRVGYGVGSPDLIAEVEKSRGPYKVNRLAEMVGTAALDDGRGWVESVVDRVRSNRDRLFHELADRGLAPLPSDANFLLVPVGPADATLVALALREREVAVRPFPELPSVGDAIRVSIGPWPLMERFLEALDDLLVGGATSGGEDADQGSSP
jgi:histidinol-phosphate aminotransferase